MRYPSPLVVDLVLGVGSCLVPVLANLGPLRRTVVRVCELLMGSEVGLVGDIVCGVSSFVSSGDFRFSGTWCLFSCSV